jgi:hypothetical protein
VLTTEQVFELVAAMEILHRHFRDAVYGAPLDPGFAMEIEFKIDESIAHAARIEALLAQVRVEPTVDDAVVTGADGESTGTDSDDSHGAVPVRARSDARRRAVAGRQARWCHVA